MRLKAWYKVVVFSIWIVTSASILKAQTKIIRVPSEFATITEAVANAGPGDTIVISPGTYQGKTIEIHKPLTISSEWILTGDTSRVTATVIDAGDSVLFYIKSNDVEISGLKIIHGDHPIEGEARCVIKYNQMINNGKDAISMETHGGGYVGHNLIINATDDGIDLDIGKSGNDIVVEYNKIIASHDDGMEIRLFSDADQNIHYDIHNNTFSKSRNAGIQLISYDVYTGKVFRIHHNIFKNCKTGLGCMAGGRTREDLNGASKMNEKVYFFNNTMLGNQMGATGGNNIIAMNNIVSENTIGGFKRFGKNSIITHNLFYHNHDSDFIEINDAAKKYDNIFNENPLLDPKTLEPAKNSPCIDAGLDKLIVAGQLIIEIPRREYSGLAPDLGALELKKH